MSKHHSQSSGDIASAKNAMSEGNASDSPELAQDMEAAGSPRRMSTEIKIGLGTLGFLLIVLVGVLIYRIWQMKASDGSLSPGEKPTSLAENAGEPAEQSSDPASPSLSITASAEPSLTASTASPPQSSPWNVDYSNQAAGASLAVTAPAWPTATPSPPTAANANSPWAEVGIGQSMLPESPSNIGSGERSTLGMRSPEFDPVAEGVSDANLGGFSDARGMGDAMGREPSVQASNSPPSEIPFGPWNAAAAPSGETEAGLPSAVSDAPPAAPVHSAPAAPDFFAGGMPITRNDAGLPQEGPMAANTPIDDTSRAIANSLLADRSTGERLTPLEDADIATPFQPYGQGGAPTALSLADGGESPSNAASRLAVAEPAQPIGSPSWGGTPAPQVPPLAAGNASGNTAVSGKTYTVQEGESLFDIARGQLGKASRWVEIYELNRARLGKQMEGFQPGITLILPQAESAATAPSPRVFR